MSIGDTKDFPVALGDMPVAEWAAAIVVRRSTRTYDGRAAEPALLDGLETLAASLPGQDTARVAIVRDLPKDVFTGAIGSYGKVVGARSGLLVIGREDAPAVQESAGYVGEALILEATAKGLDSCWVGGFFDRKVSERLVALAPRERVLAVSPLGHAEARTRATEKMLKRIVGAHKRRPPEEIAVGYDEEAWPAWAAEGVRLARSAPSAVNRQPWQFRLEDDSTPTGSYAGPTGAVTLAATGKGHDGTVSRRLDCGIAMLHFEVGARLMGATGHWETLDPPDVARYRMAATADARV